MIEFIKKFSPTEWLITAIVAIIGGLVAALKIQGFQLHRAQVQLLKAHIEAKEARNAEVTQKAYDTYKTALDSYLKAGGTLLVLAFLWSPITAQAMVQYADVGNGPSQVTPADNEPLLPKCVEALSDCDKLQQAQVKQIEGMVKDMTDLENQVTNQFGAGLKAGAAAGGVVGGVTGVAAFAVKGLVVGGVLGALVGLGIGLLVGGF